MAKRARERARLEKQAAKRERRQGGASKEVVDPDEAPDETALMEEFRVLSERHAEGLVAHDLYDQERHRIFVDLGIETDEDA
jgi:hypothetical protein